MIDSGCYKPVNDEELLPEEVETNEFNIVSADHEKGEYTFVSELIGMEGSHQYKLKRVSTNPPRYVIEEMLVITPCFPQSDLDWLRGNAHGTIEELKEDCVEQK